MKRGATLTPRPSKQIVTSSKYRVTYIGGSAMFPAWSPTRWTCCARTGKIESSLPLPGSSVSASAPCGRGKARRRSSAEVFFNAYRSGTFGIKASCFCAPIFFSPNYRGRHQRQPAPGRRAAGREKVTHITAKPRTRTNVRGQLVKKLESVLKPSN